MLVAASALYAERGPAFTVEEVAGRAGVGIGTVYRRFPTKNALLDELARPQFEQMLTTARTSYAHPVPGERLEVFVRTVAEQYAAGGVRSGRLFDAAIARPIREEYGRVVELIVADARAAGRLRADVEVRDVSVILWMLAGLIDATDHAAPVVWRRHLDLVLDGLRAGDHRPVATRPIEQADWDRLVAAAPALHRG